MAKILRYQKFLNERAKEFLEFAPGVGLVTMDEGRYATSLYFFDFNKSECVGIISLTRKFNDTWVVNIAAAEDGYGPLMYKSAMMAVYPDKVCAARDRDIRPDAVNIWRRFYHEGHEVRKMKLDDHEEFNFWDDELNQILNVGYSRPASIWFKKMIARGGRLMKSSKLNANAIRGISEKYFRKRYHEE